MGDGQRRRIGVQHTFGQIRQGQRVHIRFHIHGSNLLQQRLQHGIDIIICIRQNVLFTSRRSDGAGHIGVGKK